MPLFMGKRNNLRPRRNADIGTAKMPQRAGSGMTGSMGGRLIGTPNQLQPLLGSTQFGQPIASGFVNASPVYTTTQRVATGGPMRYQPPGPVGQGIGVSANTPASRPGRASTPPASPIPMGSAPISPMFGRPGYNWAYAFNQPQPRLGPTPKLAPGTGGTGMGSNRSKGIVPPGYSSQQYMYTQGFEQLDYTPATDPYYGLKNEANTSNIPRSIDVASDGSELLGTYRAHDSTPADRFFKQGRSAAMWQDMSFGPNYRYLVGAQQVARYNLYSSLAMVRPLDQNLYFVGYATQPALAAQIGGVGQGAPLGYGAH